MHLGDRLKSCLDGAGVSQAALARDVGISQPSVNYLVKSPNGARGSKHLRAIARRLAVSGDYLEGLTDDRTSPPTGAPSSVHVTMRVELPSERALTAMFRGLVSGIDLTLPLDEIARLLARRLPIGLSQLEDVLPDPLEEQHSGEMPSLASSRAKHHPEPQS